MTVIWKDNAVQVEYYNARTKNTRGVFQQRI